MKSSVHKGNVASTDHNGVIINLNGHRGFLARRAGPLVQHFCVGDCVSVQVKRSRDINTISMDLKTPNRFVYNRRGNKVICCIDLEVLGRFRKRTGYVNHHNHHSFTHTHERALTRTLTTRADCLKADLMLDDGWHG